jgi:hypothetical protein
MKTAVSIYRDDEDTSFLQNIIPTGWTNEWSEFESRKV